VQLRWCLLHSVPHWNSIRLYLPKGSGGFRSPKTNLWLACFGRLYEKESETLIWQAILPIIVPALFLRALRARSRSA
ncbi:MAG: hypothetical protein II343_02895, partial [Clostridia bacterium]|nr:hypothetical protein [Clostridia bacterium]